MPTSINNGQPTLALTQAFVFSGVFPSRNTGGGGTGVTLGMIRNYAFNFAANGTVLAQGQFLPISQNTAVFSLVGTLYGGNGQTTYALPDLGGALAVGRGQGPGLTDRFIGEEYGNNLINLLQSNLPASMGGGSIPVDNNQTTLTTGGYFINATGLFPTGFGANYIGAISQFAGNFAPNDAIPCDGRLLAISEWEVLFQVIGTTYGGDGQTTFAVPDLRGRVIIGAGQGPGLFNHVVGEVGGTETTTFGPAQLPNAFAGGGGAVANSQPFVAMNFMIALQGIFPSQGGGGSADYETPFLGEIIAYAGPAQSLTGWARCEGQLLPIAQNQALFSLLGTTYGGNGVTTFALPDLRGRSIIGTGNGVILGQRDGTEFYTMNLSNIPDLNINGTAADERFNGGDGNDVINGNGGNDVIASMGGIDTLNGNDGNDILVGGNDGDNLIGGNNDDILLGQAGNDTLNGGSGVNTLQGGLNDDIYIVSNSTDTVYELAGEGTDLVQTNVASFVLPANVENLSYTGAAGFVGIGNALNNVINGGTGRDQLAGGDGNDTLSDGGGGVGNEDTLIGGIGNDTYVVAVAGTTVWEAAGEGTDTVQTALASYTLRIDVENLVFTGAGSFTGTGTSQDNAITGGTGADILFGMGGVDTLTGGAGSDRYSYVGGETGVDTIVGFVSGTDKIGLSTTGFVHTGTIAFVQGTNPGATNSNSTFLYNSTTGVLSYDADGNGAGSAVQLANLGAGLSLSLGDFVFF